MDRACEALEHQRLLLVVLLRDAVARLHDAVQQRAGVRYNGADRDGRAGAERRARVATHAGHRFQDVSANLVGDSS